MPLPALPASGSTSWYAHYSAMDAAVRQTHPSGSRFKVVAAADEPIEVRDAADYVCDGTSDQVEINQAITDVASNTVGYGTNGGTVMLVGRQFNVDGAILVRTQTDLVGAYGKLGTWVKRSGSYAPGALGGLIQLHSNNVQYARIRDLAIHGAGASVNGVYINVGAGQEWDAYITVEDLYIYNCGQNGVRMENDSGGRLRGNMIRKIRVLDCGVSGFYINCPDSYYEMLDTGSSGSHGFDIRHSNSRFVNCKSWFSDGSGFATSVGRDNQFAGCEAQDNDAHGFQIGSSRQTLAACAADSNGYPGADGSGFYVTSSGFNIQGTASDKNEGSRGLSQQYGIQCVGSIKGIANVTTWQNAVAPSSAAAAITAGSIINVVDM